MRTTTLHFDQGTLTELIEATSAEEVNKAITYLSTWNMDGFNLCQLFMDTRESEISALYRKEAGGPVGYTIGAVWHDDHFGFHS